MTEIAQFVNVKICKNYQETGGGIGAFILGITTMMGMG